MDNRTLKRWFSSFSIGNALHVAAIIGTPHTTLVSRVLLWLCSKSRTIKIRSQQKVYTLRMSVDVVVVLHYCYLKKMIGSFQIGLNHLVIWPQICLGQVRHELEDSTRDKDFVAIDSSGVFLCSRFMDKCKQKHFLHQKKHRGSNWITNDNDNNHNHIPRCSTLDI